MSTVVQVSTDGGRTWAAADLAEPTDGPWDWRRWSYDWTPEPGRYTLSARATDAAGRTQPVDQPWNRGGFANNLVQQVEVVVVAR